MIELPPLPVPEDFVLDGKTPDRVLCPTTEDEAVELIREAALEGLSVVPWGGGTAINCGNRLRAERWAALDTRGLLELTQYSPDDMVVTVSSGATLNAVQALLQGHNQFLPLDPPYPDAATLGGITATNAQGLLRTSCALPRDRLLGARIVLSDGSVARAGGKVVKNVAGYDLCKLICGSFGTLGLIVEVTYRTNPIPPARAVVAYSGGDASALAAAALKVQAARLQPAYLIVDGPVEPRLVVGLMGSERAVAWQAQEIEATLKADGLDADGARDEKNLRSHVAANPTTVAARVTVRPSETPAALAALEPFVAAIQCHPAVGLIEVAFSDSSLPDTEEAPPGWWADRIRAILPRGSHLVWNLLPASWKSTVEVWGPTRPDFRLMRGLKEAFDPIGLFSPGRFVGHI